MACLTGMLGTGCSQEIPRDNVTMAPLDSGGDLSDYNLIIIALDSLRADRLGCYGYKRRDTSPFIDKIAKDSLVFENAYSTSSYTRESVTSIWSGILPARLGAFGWNTRLPAKTPSLGSLFKKVGYKTAVISNQPAVSAKSFTRYGSFDTVRSTQKQWISRNGPQLSENALELVREWSDDKFMIYMHYLDPHTDYRPPEETYFRFTKTRPPNMPHFTQIRSQFPQLMKEGFGPGDPRFEDFVLRHDAEIAHSDMAIQILFEGLQEMGLSKKTLIVLTSDHGEEFLEHGYLEHSWTVHDESIHVPLIFWAPDIFQAQRISSAVSLVDLLPTMLELFDVPHDNPQFDGVPIFDKSGNVLTFKARTKPVISEVLIQERIISHAVIHEGWKYISTQRWLEPDDRPEATATRVQVATEIRKGQRKPVDIFGPPQREALYNIAKDPGETKNLMAESPEELEVLRQILREYALLCNPDLKNPLVKPKEEVTVSPEEAERLKSIGYL
jgi:arylsulfatase A-like enzyme